MFRSFAGDKPETESVNDRLVEPDYVCNEFLTAAAFNPAKILLFFQFQQHVDKSKLAQCCVLCVFFVFVVSFLFFLSVDEHAANFPDKSGPVTNPNLPHESAGEISGRQQVKQPLNQPHGA